MNKKTKNKITKNNKKSPKKVNRHLPYYLGFLAVIILAFGPFTFYNFSFKDKIFPNIYVDGVNVGGFSREKALETLSPKLAASEKLILVSGDKSFDLDLKEVEVEYNLDESVERAYSFVRTGNPIYDSLNKLKLLKEPVHMGMIVTLNEGKLAAELNNISEQVEIKPVKPSVALSRNEIVVNKGAKGVVLDINKLRENIGHALAVADQESIEIPLIAIDQTLNDKETEEATKRAQNLLAKSLTAKFEYSEFTYKGLGLIKFIDPKDSLDEEYINQEVFKIASSLNRDAQNPKFQFDGTKVTEFSPALDGVKVESDKLKDELQSTLRFLESSEDKTKTLEIPVSRTKPHITTDKVNNLGIKEIIGRGSSTYFHSIPGRVFNVNLAASRINGTLIAPGETFSFTGTLGDVSKLTGYKEAYVISGGKTVLGDGGGVCQVSTTLFRAALNAGLPIDERVAHAYRVGYYEQDSPPGLDATIYTPRPDFKFTNNTAAHILIIAKNDPKNYSLVFELYGTKDGRVATIGNPVISNISPALPTVYQDDPTLPVGTTKQVDYAAKGARVTFNYTVTKGGEEIYKKTFVSNYQPWAAVYLKGTKTQ